MLKSRNTSCEHRSDISVIVYLMPTSNKTFQDKIYKTVSVGHYW